MYLTAGLVLGVTAGISPGPLLALIIGQTLTYGPKEGAKTALAPLLSDIPIILLVFIIVWGLAEFHWIPGLMSIIGAIYITYLGWESFHRTLHPHTPAAENAKSMQRGVLVNLLNPHPYLFWLTVGIPFLSKTWYHAPVFAVVWIIGFYCALVGSKLMLAVIVGRAQTFLASKAFSLINRILGVILWIFAVLLFHNGWILIKNSLFHSTSF